MKKIVSRIGKEFINEKRDVRKQLQRALKVGASVEEACNLARIPYKLYEDWEYTHYLISEIKTLMYSLELEDYNDITQEIIDNNQDYNIDVYLLKELQKNKYYANDVYMLIEKCNEYKAEVIIEHLNRIRYTSKQKNNEWKSSAWYLERVNPERYGKDSKGDKEEKVVEKISVEFVGSDSQDTINRLKELEKEVRESLNIVDEN